MLLSPGHNLPLLFSLWELASPTTYRIDLGSCSGVFFSLGILHTGYFCYASLVMLSPFYDSFLHDELVHLLPTRDVPGDIFFLNT